jgi:hypothetical protein
LARTPCAVRDATKSSRPQSAPPAKPARASAWAVSSENEPDGIWCSSAQPDLATNAVACPSTNIVREW